MRQIGTGQLIRGQTRLSATPPDYAPVAPTPGGSLTNITAQSGYWRFTPGPGADLTLGGIRDTAQQAAATLELMVWALNSPAAPLARSGPVSQVGGAHTAYLPEPLVLTAGTTYLIGWRSTQGGVRRDLYQSGQAQAYAGLTVQGGMYYDNSATGDAYPPNGPFTSNYPLFALLRASGGESKTVIGPLDPTDFPVVTSGDQLFAGQVALLDDGVSVPRLMRKRLNGDLVPVGLPTVDGASLTGTGAPGAPLGAAVTPARLYDTERRLRATVGGEALAPLRRVAGKIRRGEAVKILFVGSSSLAQDGASSAATMFVPQFMAALRAAFPSVTFTETNRGVGGYRLANLEAEFSDYLAVGADLTVLVIGLNDATTDGAAGLPGFRLRYEAFTRVLARNGSDVIAVDAQIWSGETEVHRQYNAAVRDAATAAGVAFYGRRDMQTQAIARGEYTQAQLIAPDGLHYQDAGHALWASSMAAVVISGVRQHGDESRAHRLEFSAAEPPVVLPVPSRQIYRAAGSIPDVQYDRFSLAAGQVGVISALWRGTGVRWLPFVGGIHANLAQVRYRIDEGAWTVLPRPWVDGAGNLRGGAWTLAQGLTDTTHLVEVECTAAAGSAVEVYHSGFEVLVPGDTAAVGSSLAAGGRMLVAQGLVVTPAGGLTLNVAMGQLLLQGRAVPARIGAAAGQALTLGAANASLPRVDLVYHSWDGVRVLAGTPAASPVAPGLPHEAVALAEVLVPAGASAVGRITDRRRMPLGPEVNVSRWPVFTGRGETFEIPGNVFSRIPLQALQDSHSGFDPGTNTYRIPEAGVYRMDMKIRYADGTQSGLSVGVGAGLQEIDDIPFAWGLTNPLRNGLQNYRIEQYPAGALVRLYGYLDYGSSRTIARSELIITRIR